MNFPRAAGVLLHPTSLPGSNGIGELGVHAHRFLDVLAAAGVGIWQMLHCATLPPSAAFG